MILFTSMSLAIRCQCAESLEDTLICARVNARHLPAIDCRSSSLSIGIAINTLKVRTCPDRLIDMLKQA